MSSEQTKSGAVEVTLRPMSSAPRDGTEILAWSEAGNFHQVYWKTYRVSYPYWGMRWASDYQQSDGQFDGWIPMPVRKP